MSGALDWPPFGVGKGPNLGQAREDVGVPWPIAVVVEVVDQSSSSSRSRMYEFCLSSLVCSEQSDHIGCSTGRVWPSPQ